MFIHTKSIAFDNGILSDFAIYLVESPLSFLLFLSHRTLRLTNLCNPVFPLVAPCNLFYELFYLL